MPQTEKQKSLHVAGLLTSVLQSLSTLFSLRMHLCIERGDGNKQIVQSLYHHHVFTNFKAKNSTQCWFYSRDVTENSCLSLSGRMDRDHYFWCLYWFPVRSDSVHGRWLTHTYSLLPTACVWLYLTWMMNAFPVTAQRFTLPAKTCREIKAFW